MYYQIDLYRNRSVGGTDVAVYEQRAGAPGLTVSLDPVFATADMVTVTIEGKDAGPSLEPSDAGDVAELA